MNKGMEKVFVGMSGGVDSSVSALLLLRKGYEVEGVTMLLTDESRENNSAATDAKAVADKLGIRLHICDFRREFYETVITDFAKNYLSGRTPNPCIVCNPNIKFGLMLDYALENGADYIATGHYAVIEHSCDSGAYLLKKSPVSKDQSYFLSRLNQSQLSKSMFPIGCLPKEEVRLLAQNAGLSVAKKSDSQEICFISDNDYAGYISEKFHVSFEKGNFIDENGALLGEHSGIAHYTVGQRKGLGGGFRETMYVKSINAKNNTVTLCGSQGRYTGELTAENMNWISGNSPEEDFEAEVKVRSTAKPARARIYPIDSQCVRVVFDTPQICVSPGQTAAIYLGDTVLGGGIIQ